MLVSETESKCKTRINVVFKVEVQDVGTSSSKYVYFSVFFPKFSVFDQCVRVCGMHMKVQNVFFLLSILFFLFLFQSSFHYFSMNSCSI